MMGFPGDSVVKNPPGNAGYASLIPGSGRSPGEGNGNPLQDSCLENPMDREAWWATVHGVTKSWIQLSNWAQSHTCMLAKKWTKVRTSIWQLGPDSSVGKESACRAGGDPGSGRSPGEGKGYPLQYSSLENSMDCIVHGIAKSRTWLSDFHFTSGRSGRPLWRRQKPECRGVIKRWGNGGTSLLVQWLRICLAMGGIPDQGTKVPHAVEKLSPYTVTTEPMCSGACSCKAEKKKREREKEREVRKWRCEGNIPSFEKVWLGSVCHPKSLAPSRWSTSVYCTKLNWGCSPRYGRGTTDGIRLWEEASLRTCITSWKETGMHLPFIKMNGKSEDGGWVWNAGYVGWDRRGHFCR